MSTLFQLPSEVLLSSISSVLPCRENQIRNLEILVSINGTPGQNIVIYGCEATGKTVISKAVMEYLSQFYSIKTIKDTETSQADFRYAIVKIIECIDGRHLFEQIIGSILESLGSRKVPGPATNIAELVTQIQLIFEEWAEGTTGNRKFVLVLDGIEKQRNAYPGLFAALTRINDLIPAMTMVFITTCPRSLFFHVPGLPHIFFPSYSRSEILTIISNIKPDPLLSTDEETVQTWGRFTAAVYDSFSKQSSRDIISFRALCQRLWPVFIRPLLADELEANPFSRLMLANRSLFRNHSTLVHKIIPSKELLPLAANKQKRIDISHLLPSYSRLLLIASYLASYNPVRNDVILFIKSSAAHRRKKANESAPGSFRSGVPKSRKISRKLLGAQAFGLERMLAIFHAISENSNITPEDNNIKSYHREFSGSADVQTSISTLISLRLIIRLGNLNSGNILDSGMRYRVTIGWEVARSVARSVGVDIENYLTE